MAHKLADGWKFGPVKDPIAKLHPCLVPFEDLPKEEQTKDFIFRAVVCALTRLLRGDEIEPNEHGATEMSGAVMLYRAIVRKPDGLYFIPSMLYHGSEDKRLQDWSKGGYKVVRLLPEYQGALEE